MGATVVLLLVQVPPGAASLSPVTDPIQILVFPAIGPGAPVTATVAVEKQPVVNTLYVIMAMPTDTPVTTPEGDIVATVVVLLLQIPPPVEQLNAEVVAMHNPVAPVMAAGDVFTVTAVVILHPVDNIYVIVAVPADIPLTMPVVRATAATDVLLLVQVPPPASLSAVVVPEQSFVTPEINPGVGSTVMVFVVIQPVPSV